MQTIRVDINNNNIFDTIMDFLNKLPQHEFKVNVEKKSIPIRRKKLRAISLKTKGFKFNREESNER